MYNLPNLFHPKIGNPDMKEIYDWVHWFRELTERIAETEQAEWANENPDPFSYLYRLAAGTEPSRSELEEVHEKYKISVGLPESVGVKTADSLSIEPKPEELASLWNLFSWAARHSNEEQGEPQDFSAVLGIYNMGVKTLRALIDIKFPTSSWT